MEVTSFEYRKDGWPLCPRCGEDELASTLSLRTGGALTAKPEDPMVCYACRWEGTVPPASHCAHEWVRRRDGRECVDCGKREFGDPRSVTPG